EFGLFLDRGRFSAAAGHCSHGDRCSGAHAESLLEFLYEFTQFENCHTLDEINNFFFCNGHLKSSTILLSSSLFFFLALDSGQHTNKSSRNSTQNRNKTGGHGIERSQHLGKKFFFGGQISQGQNLVGIDQTVSKRSGLHLQLFV